MRIAGCARTAITFTSVGSATRTRISSKHYTPVATKNTMSLRRLIDL